MKVYLIKYALSSGIIEKEAEEREGFWITKERYPKYLTRKDIAFTKEQAIDNANKMRLKRVESLKKQIKKLENIKFE